MTADLEQATLLQRWLQGSLAMVPSLMAAPPETYAELPDPAWSMLRQEWLQRHVKLWQSMLAQQGPLAASVADSLCAMGSVSDRRFSDDAWSDSPVYDYLRRSYLINAEFAGKSIDLLPKMDEKSRQKIRFAARQLVDAMSPANFAATNPEFIRTAIDSNGESIRKGILNLLGDMHKGQISTTDHSAFELGRNIAATPGSVVFENELFQLISYAPSTNSVFQRPVLMVPPCINKYYILDLRPENSLVKYAVGMGHVVFMISWRNPKDAQGGLTWHDYVELGVLTALDVVRTISGIRQINALGFCVGGTLLASALAVSRARGNNPVKSLTLLTTLLDFSDAGDLACLVDEKVVATIEHDIGRRGIFSGREFRAVFSALRANDLIWNYVVSNYLCGGKPSAFDLLYWNSDSTNLPGPFMVWYLRNLYLANKLCLSGLLDVCGTAIDLKSLKMPVFAFAAREDHIVPWTGAYRSLQCLGSKGRRFVLGASGHIAGVINPAGSGKRRYWLGDATVHSAEDWLAGASEHPGSWWPEWSKWLGSHGGRRISVARIQVSTRYSKIEPAPGRYVLEKAE